MRIGTVLVTGALVGVAGVIGLRAAQGPPQGGAAPRPLVPMTASTIDGPIRRFGSGGLLATSVKDWRR